MKHLKFIRIFALSCGLGDNALTERTYGWSILNPRALEEKSYSNRYFGKCFLIPMRTGAQIVASSNVCRCLIDFWDLVMTSRLMRSMLGFRSGVDVGDASRRTSLRLRMAGLSAYLAHKGAHID